MDDLITRLANVENADPHLADLMDEAIKALESAGDRMSECNCYRCLKESGATHEIAPNFHVSIADLRMVLCAICGNKRCPHATDHRLQCTDSNAPGQPGSNYEHQRRLK